MKGHWEVILTPEKGYAPGEMVCQIENISDKDDAIKEAFSYMSKPKKWTLKEANFKEKKVSKRPGHWKSKKLEKLDAQAELS